MSSIDTETFSVAMARLLKAFSDVVETVAEALRECIARGFRDALPSRKNDSEHSACGEKVVQRCS